MRKALPWETSGMPRQVRIEYEVAMYHVICPGRLAGEISLATAIKRSSSIPRHRRYLVALLDYIHLNPVPSGLVRLTKEH